MSKGQEEHIEYTAVTELVVKKSTRKINVNKVQGVRGQVSRNKWVALRGRPFPFSHEVNASGIVCTQHAVVVIIRAWRFFQNLNQNQAV